MSVLNTCCKIFNHLPCNRDIRKLSFFFLLRNLSSTLLSTAPGRYTGSAVLAPRILNINVAWTNFLLKVPAALRLEQQPSACRVGASQRQSTGCRKKPCSFMKPNVYRPFHSVVTILTELHRFQRMLRLYRKAQPHFFVLKHDYLFRSERPSVGHYYKIVKIRGNTVYCILPYFESSVMAA